MLDVFKNKNTSLHIALRSNALFSDLSGLVMILFAKPLADFLGIPDSSILAILGIGLFAWSLILWWGSLQTSVPRWLAWLAIDGDLVWILGSVVILLGPAFPLSPVGKWAVAILADIVLVFAIWQFFALRSAQKSLEYKILDQGNPQRA